MKGLLLALCSAGLLFFPSDIYSQQWEIMGQLTSSTNLHNDLTVENREIDQRVRYIPALSIYPEHKFLNNLDFEVAYSFQTEFNGFFATGENRIDDDNDIHRLWGRYGSEKIELRYGIQKIAFGPALILRPLRWFDSLDQKDPTEQTDGVTAVRLRYFGGHGITYWGWMIHPEDRDISSRGGRIELSILGLADLGASYHHRPAYLNGRVPKRSGIPFGFSNAGEDRYGFDIRADVVIGLWAEGAVSNSFDGDFLFESKSRIYMVGGDYTFPIGSGLYFLTEHLVYNFDQNYIKENIIREFTAVMLTYPLGMLEQLYFITEYDWKEKISLNFLRYSRTYDNYSFNVLLIANQVKIYKGGTFGSVTKIQKAVQLIIIYNH